MELEFNQVQELVIVESNIEHRHLLLLLHVWLHDFVDEHHPRLGKCLSVVLRFFLEIYAVIKDEVHRIALHLCWFVMCCDDV